MWQSSVMVASCSMRLIQMGMYWASSMQAGAACQEMFGVCAEPYFRASVFLRLCRDDQGAVALLPLFNYIMRRNAMLQAVDSHP